MKSQSAFKNFLLLLLALAGTFSSSIAVAQSPTDAQYKAIEKLMAPERQKVTA